MEDHRELVDDDDSSILELLDRLLNKGVVVAGDIAISVADVDLIYLRAQLLLSSVETAQGRLVLGRRSPHASRRTEYLRDYNKMTCATACLQAVLLELPEKYCLQTGCRLLDALKSP